MDNRLPPGPPLDGAPPSNPSLGAQPQANMTALAPKSNMGGNIQVIQLGLETAAAVAKGLDLLGQIFPGFAPVSAMLQSQLRDGFKSAIQQGTAPMSEPTPPSAGLGMMQGQPGMGNTPAPQMGLPPLPSGM